MIAWFAAVWWLLTWTAPDSGSTRVVAYEFQRGNAAAGWVSASAYRDQSFTPLTPRLPGEPESAWVSVSVDPNSVYGANHGGQALRARSRSAGGSASDWSNVTIVAAGARDTLWTATWLQWQYPVGGRVRWTMGPVDSVDLSWARPYGLQGPVLCYEDVARALLPKICALFGYWALWGALQACPAQGLRPVRDLEVR